jgi:hypothetical protein
MALFGLNPRSNKQTNKQTNHFEITEKQRKLPPIYWAIID